MSMCLPGGVTRTIPACERPPSSAPITGKRERKNGKHAAGHRPPPLPLPTTRRKSESTPLARHLAEGARDRAVAIGSHGPPVARPCITVLHRPLEYSLEKTDDTLVCGVAVVISTELLNRSQRAASAYRGRRRCRSRERLALVGVCDPVGEHGAQLLASVDGELAVHPLQVTLDRPYGDEQPLGDVWTAEPPGGERGDLGLAAG
jgi:hypothetical protein